MSSDVKMLPVKAIKPDWDLTDIGFEKACQILGCDYSSATIIAEQSEYTQPIEVARRYQAKIALMPHGVLAGADTWLVISDTGVSWSAGA